MEDTERVRYEYTAEILKALAHPSRLFIVEKLRDGEHCVCELTEMLGIDTSTVSKHLAILKRAGIVRGEKRGLKIFYSLRYPCILNFTSCIRSVVRGTAKERLGAF